MFWKKDERNEYICKMILKKKWKWKVTWMKKDIEIICFTSFQLLRSRQIDKRNARWSDMTSYRYARTLKKNPLPQNIFIFAFSGSFGRRSWCQPHVRGKYSTRCSRVPSLFADVRPRSLQADIQVEGHSLTTQTSAPDAGRRRQFGGWPGQQIW